MNAALSGELISWAILTVIFIAVVIWILRVLYHRSTKETAFVRTGLFGEKVVIDGGAFVWPMVHNVTPVNMNTLQLSVGRSNENALITKDRMRVDVEADFYVRVRKSKEAVSSAATTLGTRTMKQDSLLALLSGKFVASLREVAAKMTMEEIHEQRSEYVARVKEAALDALAENGLELESVAITEFDQTGLEYFNSSNRFDAEGLTHLIAEIEERRKTRNDIEQSTGVAIRTRNLEAEKEAHNISLESENSRLNQEREIERLRAEQRMQIAREKSEREAEAETAAIVAKEATEKRRISSEETLESAELDKIIAVAKKTLEVAAAQIEEETAKARLAEAEEGVHSARAAEEAKRHSSVELTLAKMDAEAAKLRAAAEEVESKVRAEAQRLLYQAENTLNPDAHQSLFRRKMLEHVEGIIAASVKPMEQIGDIRVMHLSGMGGDSGGGSTKSATDEVIDSALRYRVQAPIIDQLLSEIGIEGGSLAKLGGLVREARDIDALAQSSDAKSAKGKSGEEKPASGDSGKTGGGG